MTKEDIKRGFFKNLEKVNYDSVLIQFKQNLVKNKYNLGECQSIKKDIKTMNIFGYYFYGNGKDYFSYIKNEILLSGNSSNRRRWYLGNNKSEGKTFNSSNNFEFNMDETSPFDINSKVKKYGDSKSKDNEENGKKKLSNEIIKELTKEISKFYQNVKIETLVDNINEDTIIIWDYTEK